MNPNGTVRNLRPPWKKGEASPNPGGRPKRLPLSDTYVQIASQPIQESIRKILWREGLTLRDGATFAEAASLAVWMRAISGDVQACRELREAMEGKAPQRFEVFGADGKPVKVQASMEPERLVDALREIYGLAPRRAERDYLP